MKLRINTLFVGLGYQFGIAAHTASFISQQSIIALEYALHYVVHWPDPDCLQAVTLVCFKNTLEIIDCFEIRMEQPSTNRAKAQTFSDYKHCNTTKYLIDITAHKKISFISSGWGGCTSDKKVTEECGILDYLLPGDVVLANRGFTISDVCQPQTYTKNTRWPTLHKLRVITTRKTIV